MEMLSGFYTVCILLVALTLAMVHAQDDQSDFISIDCGIPEGSKYTDKKTGITYVSDAGFIEGGVSGEILPEYNYGSLDLALTTLRSFPQNIRNCYTLRPKQGKDLWSTISFEDASSGYYDEIIHLASSDYIHICLVNTGQGNPVISSIELRPWDLSMEEPPSTSLDQYYRYSFGSNERVRYRDDKYDRIWLPWTLPGTRVVQTSNTVTPGPLAVPSRVMSTAITPSISTDNISMVFNTSIRYMYIFYAHFAEVEILQSNQTREFIIYLNGERWYRPYSPSTNTFTLKSISYHTGSSTYKFEINKTLTSTLPPLINAIEIYRVRQFQLQQTEDQDAAAIWSIKSTYGLTRNWQGDPCITRAYLWNGLGCNYSDPQAAKIISLNLSSSGLSGEIATALANLTMLESLDLSYNNLTGDVPEFLARQDHLRIL
ncbi:putative transferase [Helianthus annuus]|nr:putative transferase [Helianthus annuus]KAJ0591680.1 putative transferase [Helianthus annuus]KAJ0772564.1 putative transferase [Helianthus annuus]